MHSYIETDLFQYIILPIIYLLIGVGCYAILSNLIDKIFRNQKTHGKEKKKVETLRVILKNILKYFIILFVVLIILTTYHVDVKSILAGLGIGVAIAGLAFQDILKDILAGISILIEEQFEIGDVVEIDGFRGEVIFIGLKTTRLKDYTGAVKIISNRNITEVINYSMNPTLAIVDIPIRYESNLEQVEEVLQKTIQKLQDTYQNLKGKIEIWGVDSLDESSILYKVAAPTKAEYQFQMQRQLKKDLKEGLEQEGFTIPYPQVEVHHE